MIRIFMSYGMNGLTEDEQKDERRKIRKAVEEMFNDKSKSFYCYEEIWKFKHKTSIPESTRRDFEWHFMNPMRHIRLTDNSKAEGDKKDGRLHYLGQAIMKLDKCDAVIFADDWKNHNGCRVEHAVAEAYGIPILYV